MTRQPLILSVAWTDTSTAREHSLPLKLLVAPTLLVSILHGTFV